MNVPDEMKPYFWSYDLNSLDPVKHKKLIISQILNYGSKQSTDWLFSFYNKEDIRRIAQTIPKGQWDKKSLNLWSIVLGINPASREKFIVNS